MKKLFLVMFLLSLSCSETEPAVINVPVFLDGGSEDTETTRSSQPGWNDVTPNRSNKLQEILETAVAQYNLTGLAVGITFNETKEIWSGAAGYSDLKKEERWDPSRSFHIGSVTKTFTSSAIYLLIEDGVLSLEDDLETWVPGYFEARGIKLRHLITNTSGIVSYNYVDNFDDTQPWTPTEILDWAVAAEPELRFTPGEQWEYSNTNYILLGMVIEAASGQTYEAFVQERLLTPQSLSQTYVAQSGDQNPAIVRSYGANLEPISADPSFGWSAGAMVSTPKDLARWSAALFSGEVLAESSLQQMITPVGLPESIDYGHGAFAEIDGDLGLYGHTGGYAGFLTYMYFWKTDSITVVVMSNVLEVDLRGIAGVVWTEILP